MRTVLEVIVETAKRFFANWKNKDQGTFSSGIVSLLNILDTTHGSAFSVENLYVAPRQTTGFLAQMPWSCSVCGSLND